MSFYNRDSYPKSPVPYHNNIRVVDRLLSKNQGFTANYFTSKKLFFFIKRIVFIINRIDIATKLMLLQLYFADIKKAVDLSPNFSTASYKISTQLGG